MYRNPVVKCGSGQSVFKEPFGETVTRGFVAQRDNFNNDVVDIGTPFFEAILDSTGFSRQNVVNEIGVL